MAGPWEQYAAQPAEGPWTQYGAASQKPEEPAAPPSFAQMLKDEAISSLPGAVLRGGKDVIDTGAALFAKGYDKLTGGGNGVTSLVTGQPGGEYGRIRAMNEAGKQDFSRAVDATGNNVRAAVGRVGGNIAATWPVGGVLGQGAKALGMTRLGNALASGGMTTGAPVANTLTAKLADMGIRMAGGAGTGYAAAGLIDPESANTGAVVGAALPPVVKLAGAAGSSLGNVLRGPAVPNNLRASVEAARGAGYVLPPTQAKPTLANRLTEGLAGKITTAQNASAQNQQVTNAMAKAAIGADDLTPEAIQAVRTAANSAYDDLAKVGVFEADDAYRQALGKAAGSKALPGIANKEVDDLVGALSSQGALDAQQTIESIKRLRFDGSANKGAQDPVKKALGSAQMKVAGALEDLIERNLQKAGNPELLTNFREARTTLAKVHDVEKALTAGGNVDARKLAARLAKGRPLTGELKTIAEFGGTFPKAAQTMEGMGSLPQASPLDWVAASGLSLATQNPLMMGTLLARPAARKLALSPVVQNRLATPVVRNNALAETLTDPAVQELLYRSAPAVAAGR